VDYFTCLTNNERENLRLCSLVWMDLRESVKMDLCEFGWINMCVFLSEFRG